MAYEPIERKGIYSYETVTLPDGSRWTWKPIRDRWETTADKSYEEWLALGGVSYDESYDPIAAGGGYENSIQVNESVITGTGEEILNTNNTDNTQAQIQANINQGSATAETYAYLDSHIDFTIKINNTLVGGDLYVANELDNFSIREFNSRLFEQGGQEFEVRSGKNKSTRKYRLYTRVQNSGGQPQIGIDGEIFGGSSINQYSIVKEVIEDGTLRPELLEVYYLDGSVINLDFDKWIPFTGDIKTYPPDDPIVEEVTPLPTITPVEIEIDSELVGKFQYSFAGQTGNLDNGTITAPNQDGVDFTFNINPLPGVDLGGWRIEYEIIKGGKSIGTSLGKVKTFRLSQDVAGYMIIVSGVKAEPIQINTPVLTVGNTVFSFDLSNKQIRIPYRTSNTDSVNLVIGNIKRTLSEPSQKISHHLKDVRKDLKTRQSHTLTK